MGYVKAHVARRSQKVRGFIVVASADEKLRYAVAAFENVEIKIFSLRIE